MAPRLHNKVVRGATKKQKPVPVKIVNDAPKSIGMAEDTKWRAQDDLRSLQRAEEIRRDKARMRAAQAEAKSQMKQLSTVCSKR